MPTSKESIQDHEMRLGRIETQLGLEPLVPKKPWWPRFVEWYKANPWISVPVSVLLTASSIFGGYWLAHHGEWWNKDVDGRVNTVLNAPGGLQNTVNQIKETVDRTDEKLKTLEPFIHEVIQRQFENVAKLPNSALIQRLPALDNLVATAKSQNVPVDPKLVSEVGTKLVDASRQNDETWKTALEWVNYKSFNNGFSPSLPDTTNLKEFTNKYIVNIPNGATKPKFTLKGLAPADVAAETYFLSKPDPNEGLVSGPAWIVAEGGAVGLDMTYLRNVIFHNVYIEYQGAPIVLKNVYFVDCTFIMKSAPKTQELAVALLTPSPSVTFSN